MNQIDNIQARLPEQDESHASKAMAHVKAYFRDKLNIVRNWLAHKTLDGLYGKGMHISPYPGGAIASCGIFWYMENGVRHFVMVRESGKKASKARFISVLDKGDGMPMNEALLHAIRRTFGQVFFRTLDVKLLDVDRVVAAPAFNFADERLGQPTPVQSLVWTIQITQEQAQLCSCSNKDIDVLTMPEYGLMGPEVASSHKGVYQSALRHIHGKNPVDDTFVLDSLEDLLKKTPGPSKTIH